MGRLVGSARWFAASASSNEKEQPSTKATRSSRQKSEISSNRPAGSSSGYCAIRDDRQDDGRRARAVVINGLIRDANILFGLLGHCLPGIEISIVAREVAARDVDADAMTL